MRAIRDPAPVVFVDADNTLWDTDRVFADAQIGLLDDVERLLGMRAFGRSRLAYVRSIDQAIASRHHDGLRYPPSLLAQALALGLHGAAPVAAARAARLSGPGAPLPVTTVAEILSVYCARLRHQPSLRGGVAEGLAKLDGAGCSLIIVSEAARSKVESTAAALSLASYFSRIIEGRKRPELFARILRLLHAPTAYMIGDQLDRDIAPAKAAGLTTIYFPGGFKPSWVPEEAGVAPDFRIDGFDEVPGIILAPAAHGAGVSGMARDPDGDRDDRAVG